jgi:hypothetical protein
MRKGPASHDWEKLLAHAAILKAKMPSAVTAAALHAGHRVSFDHDHVLRDLSTHYDKANAALESIAGWRTKRRIRGKVLLGEIDGIDAGLRNERRSAPLETTSIKAPGGRNLKVPMIAEMLRVKTFLLVERNATRDYLDVAALSHHLGIAKSVRAIERMRQLYAEFAGEAGDIMISIVVKLGAAWKLPLPSSPKAGLRSVRPSLAGKRQNSRPVRPQRSILVREGRKHGESACSLPGKR